MVAERSAPSIVFTCYFLRRGSSSKPIGVRPHVAISRVYHTYHNMYETQRQKFSHRLSPIMYVQLRGALHPGYRTSMNYERTHFFVPSWILFRSRFKIITVFNFHTYVRLLKEQRHNNRVYPF